MKKTLLLLLFLLHFSLIAQNKTEKVHRAKIIYNSIENLRKLEQFGLAMDHGIHKKGYWLTSDFSDSEIAIARNLGLQVDVEINDVQQFYLDQNKNPQLTTSPENVNCAGISTNYSTPTNFNLGSMGGFLTYVQMLQELDDMRTLYPNLISAKSSVSTVLTSEGRAIQWVKITKNPELINARPQALYTGVHHAREAISAIQTIYYMWYLLENYETNAEIKNIVDNTEMYFIPILNADGYIFNETTNPNGGGNWRKNRRNNDDGTIGVDNNRNYDYWINGNANQSIWNTTGVGPSSSLTYAGPSALSEAENQNIKSFVESHNFTIALNAHSFSNLLLYPYGYDLNAPTPDELIFNKISAFMVKESGFVNEISSSLYAASGDSDDWMYGQTFNHSKIYAFTPEIGSSFWPASTQIIPLCNQMIFTNLNAAKMLLNLGVVVDKSPEFIGINATFPAKFELTHYGLLTNGNYTVSVNPISTNITSVGAPFTSNSMTTIESITNSIPIGLASGTTSGDLIIYEFLINNGQTVEKVKVVKKFGQFQTVLTNDCSSVAPNWTSSVSAWVTTSESFVSPSNSITDSPNALYLANQTKTITLNNPIALTGIPDAKITFAAKWDIENNFDYVQFQVSTDNGLTWISQCGKYTNTGSASQTPGPLFDGVQTTWVYEEINLSDYIGQTIKVRFRFKSDGFSHFDGFYFDDFKVNVLQNNTLKTNDSLVSQFGIYPNPTSSFLNINTTKSEYIISIYNLQGQLILKKDNNSGFQKIDTENLSSGMYLIELKSVDCIETKKINKN
jgi:carboxypeptidase T